MASFAVLAEGCIVGAFCDRASSPFPRLTLSVRRSARAVNCLHVRSLPLHFRSEDSAGAPFCRQGRSRMMKNPISCEGVSQTRAKPIDGSFNPELTSFHGQLVLMRHDSFSFNQLTLQSLVNAVAEFRQGESMWNDLKLFTGDVDIPLTEKGVMEALAGGRAVSEIDFDIIFTSRLVRSKQTALIAMTQSQFKRVPVLIRGGYFGKGQTGDANRLRLRDAAANALEHASCGMVPVYADPSLNERCYGDLQGLSKEAAVKEFGEETVQRWRRSHDTRPPNGESLQHTIEPRLKEGRKVLIVAHGNVLRCIIAYLSGLSDEEMLRLQVITALPYVYTYDGTTFAECCVMPVIDPDTNTLKEGIPLGISSGLKKGEADSLI